jgi:hypothetical protein
MTDTYLYESYLNTTHFLLFLGFEIFLYVDFEIWIDTAPHIETVHLDCVIFILDDIAIRWAILSSQHIKSKETGRLSVTPKQK